MDLMNNCTIFTSNTIEMLKQILSTLKLLISMIYAKKNGCFFVLCD